MTNEEIIEKIRTTLAEEFEVGIDVIQPDAPLMETLELDSLDLVDMVVLVEKNFGFNAHAGRHRGRADAPRTAAVLHRLRHAHHPRGRHVFRPRAAVRHERGRHRARQSLPRPRAPAARPGADDPAAVFRHAGGHSLFLGAHRVRRARAGRALSHARGRGVRPQRARPPAVVSDARQRAEARVLQRRAPRQRVDHDAAAAHVLRAAVRPPRRRRRHGGAEHP